MIYLHLSRGIQRLLLATVGSAICAASACSSGSDSHSAAVPIGGSGGTGQSHGHVPLPSSGGTGGQAGSPADAGQANEAGQGGGAGLEQGMVVTVAPSTCSEMPTWTAAAPLAVISTQDDEKLLSITADELDIVFLRSDSLYRAHRDQASDDFGTPTLVSVPADYTAASGAALSGDGKLLVMVSSDGQKLAELSRDARTDDFGTTADSMPFQALNARAVQTLELYAAPVLAPDGNSLVFTSFTPEPDGGFGATGDGISVVYQSAWVNGQWAMPSNISHELFDGTTAKRPLPTGLSSDSRTLFYFDEATSKEVARFRDRPDAPLYTVVDLGGREGAVPNAACDRVYYTSAMNVLSESD